MSGKYSQKLLDHTKQPNTDAFKTDSKREIKKKTVEAAGDLIDNKIADRMMKVSKNSQQNNSETVTKEHDKEILKERNIYLQKKDRKLLMIWD